GDHRRIDQVVENPAGVSLQGDVAGGGTGGHGGHVDVAGGRLEGNVVGVVVRRGHHAGGNDRPAGVDGDRAVRGRHGGEGDRVGLVDQDGPGRGGGRGQTAEGGVEVDAAGGGERRGRAGEVVRADVVVGDGPGRGEG